MKRIMLMAALVALTSAKPQTPYTSYGPPPVPVPRSPPVGPYPPAIPTGPYPAPAPTHEGQDLLPESIPAPAPIAAQPAPFPVHPVNEIPLPPNSRINQQDDRLQYTHGFSDEKGTKVTEQGRLLSTNEGWEYVIAKKGSYEYKSPEGKLVKVHYEADHNGFRILPDSVIP